MFTIICGVIQTIIALVILYRTLISKKFSYNYMFLLVYYLIFSVPLILDVIFGIPNYSSRSQYIYELASNDKKVIAAFNIVNVLIFLLFWFWRKEFNISFNRTITKSFNAILIIAALLPILILLVNIYNIPSIKYASLIEYSNYSVELNDLYNLFLNITLISVPSAMIFLILNPKRHLPTTVIIYISIFIGIYMNGKRLVVFIFLILLIVNVFINYRKRFLGSIIFSIIFLLIFNITYSNYIEKEYAINKFNEDEYLQFRIDFSRDHNVKMALYKELNNSQPILDYRFQSFIYNILFFIPRDNWDDKPYPYGVYVTSSSLELNTTENLSWQMTTSLLDESIANLGVPFGILFFIIVFLTVIRIGYTFRYDILMFSLTNFLILLFLTMQFSFNMPFIFLWIFLILVKSFRKKYKIIA